MIIRQATLQDSAEISRLLTQLGYPPHDETFVARQISDYSNEKYHLLVGTIKSETVGFISLHWFSIFHSPGYIGRITAFCVDENIRSRGIGKELLQATEKFLVSQECTKVEVTSNLSRTSTHDFYKKNGYAEESKRFSKHLTEKNL